MLDGLRRLFATPSLESSGSKGRNYCTELEKAEEKGLPAEKSGVPRLVKVDGEYFTYRDRKSTRLNSSHRYISYSLFFFKKKKQ